MFRFALVTFLFALSSVSFANAPDRVLVNCQLDELVDSSIFESSLSKDEYPEVNVVESDDGKVVHIGFSVYSEDEGDLIEPINVTGMDRGYKITTENSPEVIVVRVTGAPNQRYGRITYREDAASTERLIATLNCK